MCKPVSTGFMDVFSSYLVCWSQAELNCNFSQGQTLLNSPCEQLNTFYNKTVKDYSLNCFFLIIFAKRTISTAITSIDRAVIVKTNASLLFRRHKL